MKKAPLIILMLLSLTASAQTIDEINITIQADGYTRISHKLTLDTHNPYTTIELPLHAENIRVSDKNSEIRFETLEKEENIQLTIYQGENPQITIFYGTHKLTQKEGATWSLGYSAKTTPRKTIIRLQYPYETRILTLKPEDILRSYVPDGIWIYPQKDTFTFTTTYQYDSTTDATTAEQPPETEKTQENHTITLLIAVALILAALTLIYRKRAKTTEKPGNSLIMKIAEDVIHDPNHERAEIKYDLEGTQKPQKQSKIKESILKMLNENELRIVRLLEDSDNEEITQANIQKTLEIPKSSLSDIIKHIETRKIIERRVEGRLKWIKLKKWVYE
jgi:uncharacterized membrane protein